MHKELQNDKRNVFVMVAGIIAIVMSIFHLYTSMFGILEAWKHRAVHIIFILLLAAFTQEKLPEKFSKPYQVGLILLTTIVGAYMLIEYKNIILREGMPTFLDNIVATILILLVIDAARRFVGNSMAIIATLFLVYTMFGYLLPGRFGSPNFSYGRIVAQLFNSCSGILGSTTGIAATSVVAFILFGSFLQVSGGSDFFSDIALVATKGVLGGPAKASIISSALVGSIQGNAVSNVVTTGTFTIPLMIRTGYSPVMAGAIEAAASTGGMIMPPVMGAAAFLMAEFTMTPYSTILKYAILPAVLYYLGIYFMVHLNALKNNIQPIDVDKKFNKKELIWKGLTCLVPMVCLVYLLLTGYSSMRSAVVAIGILVIVWIIRPIERMTIKDLISALEIGGKGMITVSSACIAAGIIVGTVSLTGLATKIAVLVSIAGTNVWVILILSMIVSIIFGMGLPVTASYVIAAITLGGIFTKVGIEPIQGHMFLFYFATMSAITPPVALASYTAAGIAKVEANKVGYKALSLAFPGFVIPYIFVFNKELFLIGSGLVIIRVVITSIISILCFSIALEGWFFSKVDVIGRLLLIVAAVALLIVSPITDIIGILIFIPLVIKNYFKANKSIKINIKR